MSVTRCPLVEVPVDPSTLSWATLGPLLAECCSGCVSMGLDTALHGLVCMVCL